MLINHNYNFIMLISSFSIRFFSIFTKDCFFTLRFENFNEKSGLSMVSVTTLSDTLNRFVFVIVDSSNNCYLVNLMDFPFLQFNVNNCILQTKENNYMVQLSDCKFGSINDKIVSMFNHTVKPDTVYVVVNENRFFELELFDKRNCIITRNEFITQWPIKVVR